MRATLQDKYLDDRSSQAFERVGWAEREPSLFCRSAPPPSKEQHGERGAAFIVKCLTFVQGQKVPIQRLEHGEQLKGYLSDLRC